MKRQEIINKCLDIDYCNIRELKCNGWNPDSLREFYSSIDEEKLHKIYREYYGEDIKCQ